MFAEERLDHPRLAHAGLSGSERKGRVELGHEGDGNLSHDISMISLF